MGEWSPYNEEVATKNGHPISWAIVMRGTAEGPDVQREIKQVSEFLSYDHTKYTWSLSIKPNGLVVTTGEVNWDQVVALLKDAAERGNCSATATSPQDKA